MGGEEGKNGVAIEDDSPPDTTHPKPSRWRYTTYALIGTLTHLVCLSIYLRPMTRTHPYNANLVGAPRPVLDESHIMSDDNKDARGTSPLEDIWKNDYWGRPMDSPSSHKSWRPLTVLSFRWLKMTGLRQFFGWDELFIHRLLNVVIHATVAELAGIISVKLFPHFGETKSLLMRSLAKILFALHPTHVECTANAANRPHIMALMAFAFVSDPDVHLSLCTAAAILGLLSSETAVFQIPAALVTMTVIQWKRCMPKAQLSASSLFKASLSLLPRYFVIISSGLGYLIGRYMYDTLSIPDGLIRPAENPYYSLTGTERALTYSLVLSTHIGKSLFVDPVGFSHEYGFDCVRKVISSSPLDDMRLLAPIGLSLVFVTVTYKCVVTGLQASVDWLVVLSWFATLFPVSGFVKVGTSIADRIAMPSTFAVALLGSRLLAGFVLDFEAKWFRSHVYVGKNKQRSKAWQPNSGSAWTVLKSLVLIIGFAKLWSKVDRRASEWMDSVTLLESSLLSCPQSAKSNLEISKIYSGLYPDKFDIEKSLSHLKKAEEIDPNYCDVHQQFAHCYIQQGRYLDFEERLTKSIMCPFTLGGSIPLWQQYWKVVTSEPATGAAARKRMDKYQKIIEKAAQKEMEREEKEKRQIGRMDEL